MYYVTLDEKNDNKLTYKCRRCGHVDELLGHESICVLNTQVKKGAHHYRHLVNEFTKLDPTLPRITSMKCPMDQCPTNQSADLPCEVVYKRYDDARMKFIYICTTCDAVWKTDDRTGGT
jgi:DNA-directed RNA polymerase subunit M/transcription elongation factor TFIIS